MLNPDPELIRAIDRYLDALTLIRAEERAAELAEGDCARPPVGQPAAAPPRKPTTRPRLGAAVPPHRALEARPQDGDGQ